MNCAKVIGKTFSKFMLPSLEGKGIKILQCINVETGDPVGKPLFAIDTIGVGIGELVTYEIGFQATWAFDDHMIPIDCAITSIIDSIDIQKGSCIDNR